MNRISILSVVFAILGVAAVAVIGGRLTDTGEWYRSLRFPSWKPGDWAFPVAWTVIFILCIVSIVLIWNAKPNAAITEVVIGLFVINGVLNVLWSAIFFQNRLLYWGIWDALLLFLSVVSIIIVAWRISPVGAALLIPYAAWTAFATAMTRAIYLMNR